MAKLRNDNINTEYAALRAWVPDLESAERVTAEAWAGGMAGLEEREERGGVTLVLYAELGRVARLSESVRAVLPQFATLSTPEVLAPVDWSEHWKTALEAIVIGPELVVRPPFRAHTLLAGQRELVIEPGQAFGLGSHESTRLALEALIAIVPRLHAGVRLLDVGTGSGVLALSALRLAPVRAIALDIDPVAPPAARLNARVNGLDERFQVFVGPLGALAAKQFDGVLANLLSSELLPLLPELALRTRRKGWAILSGLLASERQRVASSAQEHGFAVDRVIERDDASGERWCALLMRR